MRSVLSSAPFDLVDLLLDLEGLEVVKLGFVRLKLGVELVFAGFFLARRQQRDSRQGHGPTRSLGHPAHRLVALKEHHTTTFIARGQIVSCMIKLYRRDNIG